MLVTKSVDVEENSGPNTHTHTLVSTLCTTQTHTSHIFNCIKTNTNLTVLNLWTTPVDVGKLLAVLDRQFLTQNRGLCVDYKNNGLTRSPGLPPCYFLLWCYIESKVMKESGRHATRSGMRCFNTSMRPASVGCRKWKCS